jgi:hypothetical protein
MVLNVVMTALTGRRSTGLVALAVLVAIPITACGGEKYQYVESDDGRMFAKIPRDWEFAGEGGTRFRFLTDGDLDLAITAGDSTFPWQAKFTADPDATGDDVPEGVFETQFLDARLRDTVLLREIIDVVANGLGATDVERVRVKLGDLEGYRASYDAGDVHYDEVYLIDERKAGVYVASVHCSSECFDRYADDIDDVLTGFWVEQ